MSNNKDIRDYSIKELQTYLEEHGRKIADPASCDRQHYDWHPANEAAQKLWRCVEALRDITAVLVDMGGLSDAIRARKLKILATPAYSFMCAVRDLGNDLLGNPNTAGRLREVERKQAGELIREIEQWLPIGKGTPLRVARDKASAHIEKKLCPRDVQNILEKIPPSEFGKWLHQAILILLEFVSYDVYVWSADAPETCIRLMTNEPFGVLIKKDPDLGPILLEVEISGSPRNDVRDACRQVVMNSDWMFKPWQGQIIWQDKEKPRLDIKTH